MAALAELLEQELRERRALVGGDRDQHRAVSHLLQQPAVQAVVAVSSGWNATARIRPPRRRPDARRPSASTSTAGPCSATQGARMKTAWNGSSKPVERDLALEAADLAAERVALAAHVEHAEVVAVEHDHAGAGAEHRHPRAQPRAAARAAPRARSPGSSSSTRRPGARARRARRGRRGRAPRARAAPSAASSCRAPRSRPGGRARRRRRPRPLPAARREQLLVAAACATRGSTIALPRPSEAAATRAGSAKCVVASTIAARARPGSSDLKMPGADEDALGAELHHERGVGRRRDAAGGEHHDRQPAVARDPRTSSSGAPSSFAAVGSSPRRAIAEPADLAEDRAQVADRLDDVAGAGLALGADHRRALARSAAAPRRGCVAPQTNGTLKAHLSMWLASSAGVSTSDSSM